MKNAQRHINFETRSENKLLSTKKQKQNLEKFVKCVDEESPTSPHKKTQQQQKTKTKQNKKIQTGPLVILCLHLTSNMTGAFSFPSSSKCTLDQ